MTSSGDALRRTYAEAARRVVDDPAGVFNELRLARDAHWRRRARHEAAEIASMMWSIARGMNLPEVAVEAARWLVRHAPTADNFVLLGDAYASLGRSAAARRYWRTAANLAGREGKTSVKQSAEARIAGRPAEATGAALNALALAQAHGDPSRAVRKLLLHRRALLREGGWRDAAFVLRTCAMLHAQYGDVRSETAMLRRFVKEIQDDPRPFRRLAELEMGAGNRLRALRAARTALRVARREGYEGERERARSLLERLRQAVAR